MRLVGNEQIKTAGTWLPGYVGARLRGVAHQPVRRIWVAFADHFEPWWRQPDRQTALDRVNRWCQQWPAIARRHVDSRGRPACYTFFYPAEQYDAGVMDALAALRDSGCGDVDVHLHHDGDTPQGFVDAMGTFIERLHTRHSLLRKQGGRIAFGFIHGNWALDNSLPDGRQCGVNNEISLLRDLGCYADFTMPSAPSPAQTRMVNTIYWAKDDPLRPKSHDVGTPVVPGGGVEGDLMMIPGPLAVNVREWRTANVPRLEVGELAGNCLPSRHRTRLWTRVAPRIAGDMFIKLFGHGAPEKNAVPLLADGGALDRTLDYLREESSRLQAQLLFVSTWQMWNAVEAIRLNQDPMAATAR